MRVTKWPFFAGDAILLGLAYFIYWQGAAPLPLSEIIAGMICVAMGAGLGIAPFVLDYRTRLKSLEVQTLGSALEKIQNLEALSAHIGSATSHWQLTHETAEKTSAAAREISERMSAELKDFKEFLSKANDNEKTTLRIESDKLRRAEGDWLQTLVRVMDHVHALNLAAEKSGQPQVVSQIGAFQNACRETVRRLGLIPFVPAASEKFDAKRHQVAGGSPVEGAAISETLATGYTFQSRIIRPALVKLAVSASENPDTKAPEPGATASQLSLDPSEPSRV